MNRKMTQASHYLALALVVLTTFSSRADEPLRLALLIGVQKYANLDPGQQLDGPGNDVELMRQLLVERFGFRESDIVTLLDEQATGRGIREQFSRVAERVKSLPKSSPPAQVLVHFSGHGSQVADQSAGDPDRDELDGLDETLVPYDASRQGGQEDIRDDEIYHLVDTICAGGQARLWMILDCCHSGTGARGGTKIRKLNRDIVLAPETDRNAGIATATQRKLPQGAVILSACRSLEVEPEFVRNGQHFGLLSRFLVQVLSEQETVSRLSYASLREAIEVHYRQDSSVRQAPKPQIEGDAESLSSIVMSSTQAMDRDPWWTVIPSDRDGTRVTIRAGTLHGVTVGSLFELYERPDQIEARPDGKKNGNSSNKSLAWIRVEKVDAATATGRIFRWKNDEQIDDRTASGFVQGYAVERVHQHGNFGLRVQIVRALTAETDGNPLDLNDAMIPAPIRRAFSLPKSETEATWLQNVAGDEAADVLIRMDGDYCAVFPFTSGIAVSEPAAQTLSHLPQSLIGGWGPIDLRLADASDRLTDLLRQITRARNLLQIAEAQQDTASSNIRVKVELMEIEIDDNAVITRAEPWRLSKPDSGDQDLIMPGGSLYTVRVTNLETAGSGKPVFVSVLIVDADMGIDCLIPYQLGSGNEEQQLMPDESRLGAPFQCSGADGEPPVGGPRTVVVLATREPNDFYRLTQPALEKTRGIAGSESTLGELLLERTWFQKTRGDSRLRPRKLFDSSWATTTITWKVVP